jgi:hypothetical protein
MENITIYKIQHKEKPELLYIGSTFNYDKRINQHKYAINNNDNKLKVYETIRANGGSINFNFEKIIEVLTTDKDISKIKLILEAGYYKMLKPTMNSNHVMRTYKEYYRDNYKEITEKKSCKSNCECGGKYRTDNWSHHNKSKKHITYLNNQNINLN